MARCARRACALSQRRGLAELLKYLLDQAPFIDCGWNSSLFDRRAATVLALLFVRGNEVGVHSHTAHSG
jgi:hypothetical protein